MNNKLVFRIKRRTQPEAMIWIIMVLPFAFAACTDLFHLPAAIKYICDIAWMFLLILMMLQRSARTREQKIFQWFCIAFFVYTIIAYIFNIQSVLYYFWGVRNNFRFYVAFLAFCYFLKEEHIKEYLRLFDKIFWLNAAICFIQYVFLGKRGDYLGGLFGTQKGCNAYTNILFVIVIIKDILFYLNGLQSLSQCVLKCGTAMLVSAWAELKFFYVEFVVIVVVAILMTSFTWKKVLVVIGSAIGVVVATRLLGTLFPEFADFFSVEVLIASAADPAGYTGKGDMNRLTAIPTISARFLRTPWAKLIGMGLGNCDTASYSFLITPFYLRYSSLNYTWLSSAFVFLETGYLGLVFFFGFFMLVFVVGRKVQKTQKINRIYCQMAMIAAVCCVMIGVYNSSLRTEAGYMIYFIMALPFISRKNEPHG